MKKSAKILCAILALVLTLGVGVGGTLAYIAAKTGEVVNTFTYGNLTVKITETTGKDYQIVPGTDIHKNPTASVEAVSGYDKIPAYLFVKVVKTNWPSSNVTYSMAADWKSVPDQTDVYYREITVNDYGTPYQILAGDNTYTDGVIKVAGEMTKAQVEKAKKNGNPVMTFTAYAVQKDNLDVKTAWAQAETGAPGITEQK